ncbi:MAG: OmpH family outer membrane protein [Verrucomicrobiota bacterium]
MISRQILPLILCLAAAGSLAAQDQNAIIAVVDLKAAIKAHPASEALEASLKTAAGNANSVLNAKREELAAIAQEGRELQENPVNRGLDGKLLPNVVTQLNELQKRGAEVNRSVVDINRETRANIEKAKTDGLAEIAAGVSEIVKVVNNGRYAIVVDRSSVSRDGLPSVLDYSGADDITEEVIAKIKELAAETAQPANP